MSFSNHIFLTLFQNPSFAESSSFGSENPKNQRNGRRAESYSKWNDKENRWTRKEYPCTHEQYQGKGFVVCCMIINNHGVILLLRYFNFINLWSGYHIFVWNSHNMESDDHMMTFTYQSENWSLEWNSAQTQSYHWIE